MSQHDSQASENERLVLFSDAVIAITITLMVLEIRLPEGMAEMNDVELWAALVSLWPRYFAYLLSFVVIGMFWIAHHRKFELIKRNTGALMWLNLAFLCAIGFMPFVTDVLAENGGRVATMVYAGLITIVGLFSSTISFYAASAGLTLRPVSPWKIVWPSLTSALVFAASIPIALIDADAAKYFWLALIPASVIADRVSRS